MAEKLNFFPGNKANDYSSPQKHDAFFQPKLFIDQPNDPVSYRHEQEADNVADTVMRMNTPSSIPVFFSPFSVQPNSTAGREEEEMQRKPINDGTEVNSSTENYISSLNDAGRSLTENEKHFFEPRFGYDFSNVRLHTETEAARSASSINALAYTHGNHIVFGSEQYQPGTETGKRLMAHELTHILQQKQLYSNNHIARATPAAAASSEDIGEKIEGTFIILALSEEPAIMGKEFTADCETHQVTFKFPKAYKTTLAGKVRGNDFKGVYVNIEAHYKNKTESGTCGTLKLLQVLRYFKMNDAGTPVTTEPTLPVNKTRAGMGMGQPSEGWFVDTGEANPDPFYASSGWGTEGKEGTENTPAALWDIPASLPARSYGKEFFTCAVCENEFDKTRSFAACINWGYVIDNDLNVQFYPSTPVASCTTPKEVTDASKRWDMLEGVNKTGISY